MVKFDGNLISLYLSGMIRAYKGSVKDTADYLKYMLKIDKEGKDFWNAVYSLLKKLHKKELGENKMSKKEKEVLDEGIIMMSGLTPVMGPKLSLSMRGNKPDNFEFKGLPGQFNEDGEKIMDDQGNLLNEVAFTKKHYTAIANVLKGSSNVKEVGKKLADIFEDDNPNFKRDLFLKAAGIPNVPY